MRYALPLFCFCIFLGSSANAQTTTLLAANHEQEGSGAASAAATPAGPTVYNTAELMPAFAGGPAAYQEFMRRTLRYPDAALDARISGKVHVRFTVDEQGRLLSPEIAKGLGYGLDEEALRLVRLMPWWTPGQVGGQPVRVRYVLPVVFRAL